MPGVDESVKVTVTVPSHASATVGSIQVGIAGQSIGVVCVAQVIVGGVLSRTTIEALQVAVLPQSSVAVHVRVAVYVPVHVPGVEESVKVTVTVPSHASATVGAFHSGTAGQLIGVV